MKMIRLCLLNLLLVCLPSTAWAEDPGYADSIELRELFVNKNYKQLMSQIVTYQKRYEADIRNETAFELVFHSFNMADSTHEAIFDDWIRQYPSSYIPYLARSYYFTNLGWKKRGQKYASETSYNQFNQLKLYHRKALADIDKAIAIKPDITLSYAARIDVSLGLGDDKMRSEALLEGLKVSPASYEIRKSYLFSILPKWGGSFDEIAEFLADTKQYENRNSNLKPLAGFIYYVKGMIARERNQFAEGLELLTKAIEYGEKSWFYYERGLCYYQLNDYDKAISDLSRSVAMYPENISALYWRSWSYREKEMYAEALGDLDLVVQLEPTNAKYISNRGAVLTKFNQFDEALDDFKKAAAIDNSNAYTWSQIGWYSSFKLNDYQTGANAYKKAVELEPGNVNYLYNYAIVLNNMRDCKMKPLLQEIIQLCGDGRAKGCSGNKVNWAKEMTKFLANGEVCPA